jgi:hypothetical protein
MIRSSPVEAEIIEEFVNGTTDLHVVIREKEKRHCTGE